MSRLALGLWCIGFASGADPAAPPGRVAGADRASEFVERIAGEGGMRGIADGGQVKTYGVGGGFSRLTIKGRRMHRVVLVGIVGGWSETGTFEIRGGGPDGFEVDAHVTRKEASDLGKLPDLEYTRKE